MNKDYCLNVWPLEHSGRVKALAMLTINDAITVFPILVEEGKSGLRLSMRGTKLGKREEKPTVIIHSQDLKHELTRAISAAYHPQRARFYRIQREKEFAVSCKAFPCEKKADYMVGTAEIVVDGSLRITGIRMFQSSSGKRVTIFPEKQIRENGEYVFRRIVDFKYNWEDIITKKIWQAYDRAVENKHRERR